MNIILAAWHGLTSPCGTQRGHQGAGAGKPLPRAFTIIELLVVITLIVILILIAVPSFQAMLGSSEEAMAQTQLQAALRAARDAAIRSNGGADAAAVFLFEPGGRTIIVPCVKVGEFSDDPYAGANVIGAGGLINNATIRREVFAAAPGFSPISLPKYWNVRAYVDPTAVNADAVHEWYGSSATTNTGTQQTRWVFPETGFYDTDLVDAGYDRSTFMVRFQAGTGVLVGASTDPVLVLAPRRSYVGRNTQPFNFVTRPDQAEDPVKWVRGVLAGSKVPPYTGLLTAVEKRRLIGRISSDMVLARPVMQLALYDEKRLAAAFGVRLDSETGSIYAGPRGQGLTGTTNYHAAYSTGTGANNIDAVQKLAEYMRGDTNFDGIARENGDTSPVPDRPEAHLFAINRYTGAIRELEVQP